MQNNASQNNAHENAFKSFKAFVNRSKTQCSSFKLVFTVSVSLLQPFGHNAYVIAASVVLNAF